MNKDRRERLNKAKTLIEEGKSILEDCQSEEQEFFDNMPQSMQGGEKGQKAEQTASDLEEACNNLDDVITKIEEAAE